jgi:hypothetical protein
MCAMAGPAKDERLIDPAKLSRDPNTSVGIDDVSRDGTLLAYRCSRAERTRPASASSM